jgi:diguanylate cyclase (GGDEF)-like protein
MKKTTQSKCPHTIVLVEDDPNVSMMLTRHLERAGYSVRSSGSIGEARQILTGSDWDLLLLDRNLPDGDGVELCSELRPLRPDAYIMIISGASSENDKVEGFNCGSDDYVTKPFNIHELLARVRAGLRIVDLQKALIASNRRLEEMSLTDDLTQLRNRRAFDRELTTRFATAKRYDRPLSMATVDIDYFKQINDTYGHQGGDSILHGVARILDSSSRVTDFVARVGGEEFCVLLPETGLFEAIQFGEKIRASVAANPIEGQHVTVSIGISSVPHSLIESADELMFASDQAMYRAKVNGRNRVESEKRRERFAKQREKWTGAAPTVMQQQQSAG